MSNVPVYIYMQDPYMHKSMPTYFQTTNENLQFQKIKSEKESREGFETAQLGQKSIGANHCATDNFEILLPKTGMHSDA